MTRTEPLTAEDRADFDEQSIRSGRTRISARNPVHPLRAMAGCELSSVRAHMGPVCRAKANGDA